MTQQSDNRDNKPWWLSSGPPRHDVPPATERTTAESAQQEPEAESQQKPHEQSHAKEQSHDSSSFFGISPEMQATAVTTGLGLLTAVMDMVAKPMSDKQESTHDVKSCGVCPLCVAVAAIREQDAGLADLIESAMSGVTGSVEKLSGMLPDVMDKITEALVSAAVKTLLNRK